MHKIGNFLKKRNTGSMGIGAMIIFIAMVLVAGIAASVLVQVANTLQMQALFTGHETIAEVSTGIAVIDVEGYVNQSSGNNSNASYMTKLAIGVRGRAGSGEIDLAHTIIELADNETKAVLSYDEDNFVDLTNGSSGNSSNATSLFDQDAFDLNGDRFGIIVVHDADKSVSNNPSIPIINRGDYVMLTISTNSTFNPGLSERVEIWGSVIPEIGSWGIISFRTPSTFVDQVYDLQ